MSLFIISFSLSPASLLFISSLPVEAPFLFLGLKENAVLFFLFSLAYSLSYHAIQYFYPDKRKIKAVTLRSYGSNASCDGVVENSAKRSLYARFDKMFLSKAEREADDFQGSHFFDNEYKLEQPGLDRREDKIKNAVDGASFVL